MLLDGVLKPPRLPDGILEPPRLLVGVFELPSPPRTEPMLPRLDVGEFRPDSDEPIPDRPDGSVKAPDAEIISPARSRTVNATITRFISLPSTHCRVE
jgi:hypothetical protein